MSTTEYTAENQSLLEETLGEAMGNIILPYSDDNEFVCTFIDNMNVGDEHVFSIGDKRMRLQKTAHIAYGNYNMRITEKIDG